MKEYKIFGTKYFSKWDDDVEKNKYSNGRLIQMFTFRMSNKKEIIPCSLAFYYLKSKKSINKAYVRCELIKYKSEKVLSQTYLDIFNPTMIIKRRYVKEFKYTSHNDRYYTNSDLIKITCDIINDFICETSYDLSAIFKNKFKDYKIDLKTVRKLKN